MTHPSDEEGSGLAARPVKVVRPFQTISPIRTLPNSLEAEANLLASCLLDGQEVVAKCIMGGVSADSFYESKHGMVYDGILELYTQQKAISVATLAELLKTKKQLEAAGGYPFLTQITTAIPTTAEAKFFIEKVVEQATLRAIIRSRTGTVESCYNYSGDLEQFIADIVANETRAIDAHSSEQEQTVREVADELLKDLGKPASERSGFKGEVSWGIESIDRICGTMGAGTLNVLAAQPSAGKSCCSSQVAWCAANSAKTTLVFSYEMRKADYVVRIAQQESRVNMGDFNNAPMDKKLEFTKAIGLIRENKYLHIFEQDNTLNRLIARARTIHRKEKVGLIVIDFLQRLSKLEPTVGNERTDEKLGRITTSLSNLAKELECPVLLLSALNRDGYREGATPNMSSIRNSGEIESDADVIMMLHWPKENPITGQPQDPHDENQGSFYVDLLQEKGRAKGVHKVGLMFTRKATRFDPVSSRPPAQPRQAHADF